MTWKNYEAIMETNRLKIHVSSREEMEDFISIQENEILTEAVSAVVNMVLERNCVTCVTAETEKENSASIRALEKCGFVPMGEDGEEGPRHVKRKEKYELI